MEINVARGCSLSRQKEKKRMPPSEREREGALRERCEAGMPTMAPGWERLPKGQFRKELSKNTGCKDLFINDY